MDMDTPFTRGKYTSEIIRIFMFLSVDIPPHSVLRRHVRMKTIAVQRVKSGDNK